MYSSSPNVHQAPVQFVQPPQPPHTIITNGHAQTNHSHQRTQQPPSVPKERIVVLGIPSVHIHTETNQLVVGSSQTSSTRSYTPLKMLGDGSFGTVWLCDWHGTLPPNTPLSPMQCGAARPEWAGKRLVAVKRMKKKWEGGWDECQKLKEIESLRAIPFHPNIIPLYDFFLLPASKELYFVFESMEGNLYHLIKARKGRPLAGGLVSSIFRQIVSGLDHIHFSGYFHRDMKPENVLVTTTGLYDYVSLSPIAPPNASPERDVIAIIKLADFGLARETRSKPPYTEYVSTRWYRAPEVLLLSRDYSNPVDMWALGTIMAELINLRPLFPGVDQVDQVANICEILGDPCDDYRLDNTPIGGGAWEKGIQMAKKLGFQFPKMKPRDIFSLFEKTVPRSLILCIRDLLKYDPDARLTTRQCLQHPYLLETTPRNNPPLPSGHRIPPLPHIRNGTSAALPSLSPHSIPSHPHSPHPHTTHRSPFFPSNSPASSPSSDIIREESRHPIWVQHSTSDEAMDTSQEELADTNGHPMDVSPSHPVRSRSEQPADVAQMSGGPKPSRFGFGKKHSKWTLFGGDRSHQQGLAPVQENLAASGSASGQKRAQSPGSDGHSVQDSSSHHIDIKKMNKKEAEKVQREAEQQRRALAQRTQREQARAVMQKRNQIIVKKDDIEWIGGAEQRLEFSETKKGKQAATGPIRQTHPPESIVPSVTLSAAPGHFTSQAETFDWRQDERSTKARRIDYEDDQSMSSSDIHSTGRMSTISFATVDSDPGPSSRIRNRPSQIFGINRMQSTSSLRTSIDDSARSSNSFSLEGQLAHDFRTQATVDPVTPLSGSVSPPPMQLLSISPSLSPSAAWMQVQRQENSPSGRGQVPPYMPDPRYPSPKPPYSPFDFNGHAHPPSPYGHPPNSGHTSESSDINPIFKVPPLSDEDSSSDYHRLPPFSELEAVAGAGYDSPPLSPMAFTMPED